MNARGDRQIFEFLDREAGHASPDYLADILTRTARTRQRPAWSFLERWLPMGVLERRLVFAPRVPWRGLAVAAVLLAILATALILVGQQRRLPPPFGLAKNGVIAFGSSGEIYALDAITATPRLVIGGASFDNVPIFSRDGTQLVFFRSTSASATGITLTVANADGSRAHGLIDLAEAPASIDWSSDGSEILVAGIYHGVDGVFIVRPDGTAPPRRLQLGMHVSWPAWRAPDGREIVWIETQNLDRLVYAAHSDGSGRRLIRDLGVIESFYADQMNPAISPDGRSMTYALFSGDRFQNHLLDLDTGTERTLRLGPQGAHELNAVWSPDGSQLLFHSVAPPDYLVQVTLAPLDGSRPAIRIGPEYSIVNGTASVGQEFSPDGKTIIINQSRDDEVRVVDAATGGSGRVLSWQTADMPGWQRLAP